MKYSIIICYRDREKHLKILLPRLKEVFGDEAEIIVVEQDDDNKFLRGTLFNVGAQHASGDVLIFHDVDHYPVSIDYDVSTKLLYDLPDDVDVMSPLARVTFVDDDLIPKEMKDVPSGYRHFKDAVDDDFFGGVSVFRKEAFFKINGFNPAYRGWGLEDADLRERIKHYDLKWVRGNGKFYALDHPDSNPGLEDGDFQRNTQLFAQWINYLEAGIDTQFQTVRDVTEEVANLFVDSWIKASNFITVRRNIIPFMQFDSAVEYYEDEAEKHISIWQMFKQLVNEHPTLKSHRDWVVEHEFGYGNRAFHWMWNLIVRDALPNNFKFLEIGVYMGQTISLINMLSEYHQKPGMVYGITPLNNAGDKYSKHKDIDYERAIQTIYGMFRLDVNNLRIIQGLSQDESIIKATNANGPYDVVYVDGCHDYPVVVSDIQNYSNMVKVGGFVVVDDASNYLSIPDGLIRMNWRGLEDVSNAVRDTIEKDLRFKEVLAVGHNRVWEKIK